MSNHNLRFCDGAAMKLLLFLVVVLFLVGSASAATYYVATDGSNSDPGTVGEPWLTMTYAESQLSDGDTVIVRGGSYKENFIINVANVTFQNYTGEFPIIDGDEEIPGEWTPLVTISSYGVTFDGFEVRESTGLGISLSDSNNITVRNCHIHETFRHALRIYNGADNALIEDCDIHNGSKRHWYYENGYPEYTTPWPPTVSTKYVENPTFRRCKIHDSYWEGFDIGVDTIGATVEYCELYGNPRLQLYLCGSTNNTIRYNLIYGTTNGNGTGLWVGNEAQWEIPILTSNSIIYGNLVANTLNNLWIAGATGRIVENVTVNNNIFIEAIEINIKMESTTGGNHTFKNNIIWQTDDTISSIPSGKMDCDYNLWNRTPDADSQGSNDPTYAVPQIAKSTGWDSLTGGELGGSEFTLNSTSPAIDNGTDLGSPYNMSLASVSTWVDDISLLDQDDYGIGWEIGAFVYGTAAAEEESAPTTSDFTYYKIITINQTMVNQSIGTGIYPLLVSTTDTDLRDHCQSGGDDIVFFDADNTTLLPYEQEFWNSTNGELVEHVGVTDPTNVTHIVMYYNNSTIANSENATGVWDSNFVVVQHLNETPAGTTYDSTSNNNDGTTTGMDSADQVTGQVDGSLDFDGADRIPLTSLAVDNNAAFTISTWMYGEPGGIAYGEGYSVDTSWALFLGVEENSPYSARFYYKENNAWKALTTGTTQVNDTWHHVVLSQASKSSRTMYIDGVAEETDTEAVGDMSTLDTASIGVLERSDFASYFVGQIDELRISDIARSAEWTETEYNNTAFPALFISIGAEQGGAAPDTKFEYWDGDSWEENPEDYHLWFYCPWNTSGLPDGVCENAEQSGSQYSLRITNNGSAAGVPYMKFNESSPAEVTVYVDDDYTVADAVVITDSYQAVSTSLGVDENVTLSAWAKLEDLTSIWEYIVYVEVQ